MRERLSRAQSLSLAAIVAYVALSLLPLLSSGFYSDDLINSTLQGQLQLQGKSFIEHVLETNRAWITASGRLFPVHLLTISAIAYVSSALLFYKILLLSLNTANVLLFGYLLRVHTGHTAAAYLGMLVLPGLFQFRLYHDPILSFCGMMQVFVSCLLAAMILLCKYLEQNRTTYLLASLIAYNLALYYYEVSILLLPLFVVIVVGSRLNLKDTIWLSVPYVLSVVVALVAMGAARYMRDVAAIQYSGIVFNLQTKPIVKTFALQLYASLPLTYFTGNPARLFRHDVETFVANIARSDLSVLVLLVSLYGACLWKPLQGIRGLPMLCVLGSILMVAPSLLVSMSLKYQGELLGAGRGMGYIPVYVEYYGTALVITGCLLLALQRLRGARVRGLANTAVVGVGSIVLLVNLQSNRLVVEKANVDVHYRRAALTRALTDNILADVPDGAELFILDEYAFDPYPWVTSQVRGWSTGYRWKNEALVYLYARRRMYVGSDLVSVRNRTGRAEAGNDTYLLRIRSYPETMRMKEGYVVLSKVLATYLDRSDGVKFESIPIRFNFAFNGGDRRLGAQWEEVSRIE